LRDRTIEEVMKKIPFVRLNGDRYKRLPGNVTSPLNLSKENPFF